MHHDIGKMDQYKPCVKPHQHLDGKKPIAGATRHIKITQRKKASLSAMAWRPLAPAAIAEAPAIGYMYEGAESWMVPANA